MKQPFLTSNLTLELSYNILECYQSALRGTSIPLENRVCRYTIDRTTKSWSSWEDWYREVVWYGNKKGAYLYGNNVVESQLAGHY